MSQAALEIRLLGSIQLIPRTLETAPGSLASAPLDLPSSKARSLLAYLIVHHDRSFSRDRLAGRFWPERPNDRARRALSQALWQIRSALGPAADHRLVAEQDTVAFRLRPGDQLDVEAFEKGVRGNSGSSRTEQIRTLSEAVALYRADFLEACYDDWALVERERLRELYLGALEQLITLHKQRGAYERALIYGQRLVAADPLREAAHRELMQLYHLLDRPRAALEQFTSLEELLRQELDISPTPATVALYQEIAGSLDELAAPYLPVPPPPPPLLHDLAHLPFVGRRDERKKLLDVLRAAAQGHGGLALVEGDAGVGKTRLVNEVAADAAWRGFQVGVGKVDPVVAAASYQPFRDALAPLLTPLRLAQLGDMVSPRRLKAVAPLLPIVNQYVPDSFSLPPLSPEAERERLWEGIVHILKALSTAAPLLLVLEDLHWADDATLLALPHVVPQLVSDRILLVLSYRSAEARERATVWEALERLNQIHPPTRVVLAPLTQDDATRLIRRALATDKGDDQLVDFARRLHRETGGNTFFLIEILKALLEYGTLSPNSDRTWQLPPREQPLPTPASIQELISGRLARLEPTLRQTLRQATVLGEDADFEILSHISDTPTSQLVDALGELCQRGFLVEAETGYRFEHDLIHEAVYGDVDPSRLTVLHRRAGEALEAIDPARTESMAFHFHRGQVPEKALAYTLKAADEAQEVYDYETALTHYRRAYGLVADDPRRRWDVLFEEGDVLYVLGREEEYQAVLDEMSRLAERIDDTAIRAHTLYLVGNKLQVSGSPSEALAMLQEALGLVPAEGQQKLIGQILLQMAYVHWRTGDIKLCRANAEEALTIFRSIKDREEQARVLRLLTSLHLGITGDYATALALSQESRRSAIEIGDGYGAACDLANIALAHILLGDYEATQEPLEEALDFMAQVGERPVSGALRVFQAISYRCLGQFDKAREAGLMGLEICRQAAETNFEIEALGKLGLVAMEQGDLGEARAWFEKAGTLADSSEQTLDCAENRSHLALVEALLGNCELALRLSDDALAVMEAAHEVSDRLKTTYWERAQILALAGDPSAASHYLERAHTTLMAVAERVSDADLRRSFLENVSENRAIIAAYRLGRVPSPPRRAAVRLAAASAPTGRPLREGEYVDVTWTLAAPEDDAVQGRVARRRHRILRLLREAVEQSAAPTLDDLADALDVSASTIKRDLAALREAGHEVPTRGSRGG